MYRVSVAKATRGPLNPVRRPDDPALGRGDWSRFDTPGLTVYGADLRETAFTEALAFKAPSARNYAGLAEVAKDQGIELVDLLEELKRADVPVGGMDPNWRMDREIYTLGMPSGPWVDLTHPDTVRAVKASGIAAADRLTIADLTGDDRSLTTRIAQWIRAAYLQDGRHPAGIRYPSKFGFSEGNYCWACFIAAPNAGCTSVTGSTFSVHDVDLIKAVQRTGVHVT